MPRSLTAEPVPSLSWTSILERLSSGYDWLATWAERNVEPGEDGLHLPPNLRRILEDETSYM